MIRQLAERWSRRGSGPAPEKEPNRWQQFSIGIYVGTSPFCLRPPDNVINPVITSEAVSDVPAEFVADPFMLKVGRSWYMFFEVMNHRSGRGEIAVAISENAVEWTYQHVVLAEPFHLSYPYVFEWMGKYFMIPETGQSRSVRLYKAARFPLEWSYVGTLLSGRRFVDASVVHYAGRWWLFTETNDQMRFDTLRVYHADDLLGPWHEHPGSPVVEGNPSIARPAGRMVIRDDRLIRYAQNCRPAYGTQVCASEVFDLTTTSYREREATANPILSGNGTGWNADGMHHIDPHRLDDGSWIACVDGWAWRHSVEKQD